MSNNINDGESNFLVHGFYLTQPLVEHQLFGSLHACMGDVFFKRFYLFLEKGEGREKERERNINVRSPLTLHPTGDLARKAGTCPDWESNR